MVFQFVQLLPVIDTSRAVADEVVTVQVILPLELRRVMEALPVADCALLALLDDPHGPEDYVVLDRVVGHVGSARVVGQAGTAEDGHAPVRRLSEKVVRCQDALMVREVAAVEDEQVSKQEHGDKRLVLDSAMI